MRFISLFVMLMKIKQIDLAKKIGLSQSFLSMIISGRRRPSWDNAKKLAAFTSTDPVLWLDGTADARRSAVAVIGDQDE
jgi:transcriptional regulator with XRE-family HTH domain